MDFRNLPNELNEHIASFLEDADLCRFTLICRHTCDAVRDDGSGIWRKIFKQNFDLDPSLPRGKIRSIYQDRRTWLRKGAKFVLGKTKAEIECLRVIRDLITESYIGKTDDGNDEPVSKNIITLEHFVRKYGLFHENLLPRNDNKRANPLLHTIRVMLSHINLDFHNCGKTYGFPYSQIMAYRSSLDQPIFLDPSKQRIDMLYVSHLLNFFRYHMTRRHEYTLFDEYTAMADEERPQVWRNRIKAGSNKLGRYWKGTYSYISGEREFFQMRSYSSTEDQEAITADEFNGFQDLEIEFPEGGVLWPRVFEEHLHAFPPTRNSERTRARAQSSTVNGKKTQTMPAGGEWKNVPFRGVGADTESFLATGWLNPLPPQPYTRSSPCPTSTTTTTTSSSSSSSSFSPRNQNVKQPPRPRVLRSTTSSARHHTQSSSLPIPGIPGFQRLVMMKYYPAADGTYDDGALWAYEGVVLPGGMLIVGRWWNASDERGLEESFSGPFVLWNVDRSVVSDDGSEGNAEIVA